MGNGLIAFGIVVAVFLLVLAIVISITVVGRLSAIEHHCEKTALLLTVLANLQGATQDDINKAVSTATSIPVATEANKPTANAKKAKGK